MKEQQLSPTKTMSLGLQHVLAMYAGAMLVPIIVGGALGLTPQQLAYLISIDLVTCGIATLLQMWKNKYFGTGLQQVSVRFSVTEVDGHYHVPLIVSPWNYQVYRGS